MFQFQELGKRLAFKSESGSWKLVTEPPVTFGSDLSACREKPLVLRYPCHSQTVEHAVATTSGAVRSTVNYEYQLGNAFTTVDSRKSMKGKVSRKRLLSERAEQKSNKKFAVDENEI